MQGALAAQKARVLELNKQRDELNVLRRDIESAQRAFEIVSQRASQTNIESQTNQTNIAVLNPASPPPDPSKPKVFLNNVLVSMFLGTLLGIGLALGAGVDEPPCPLYRRPGRSTGAACAGRHQLGIGHV